jgi:hypothetical protein
MIIRSFRRYRESEEYLNQKHDPAGKSNIANKGVSKKIGEYIDYEDVDK